MTISELIQKLDALKKKHGDIEVKVQTLSHLWEPEPETRPFGRKAEFVLLNP